MILLGQGLGWSGNLFTKSTLRALYPNAAVCGDPPSRAAITETTDPQRPQTLNISISVSISVCSSSSSYYGLQTLETPRARDALGVQVAMALGHPRVPHAPLLPNHRCCSRPAPPPPGRTLRAHPRESAQATASLSNKILT